MRETDSKDLARCTFHFKRPVSRMLKRLHIYFKERYPLFVRFLLGVIIFGEIYFIILLNFGVTEFKTDFWNIMGAFTGAYTIFAFLLWLRIADDLKDDETDKRLFPERPLARGAVTKWDIRIAAIFFSAIAVVLNVVFMRENLLFFAILYAYGFLMRNWFFAKYKIQPSLPLAVITHNPVQIVMNLYIIAYTVQLYDLPAISPWTILTLWTLYFPALIWEISRKIRAPKDETEYTTYSKLFGYKKMTKFVMILTLVDICTNFALVFQLNHVTILLLALLVTWMTVTFVRFMRDPERFKLVEKVEIYTYIQESLMLLTVAGYLIFGRIGFGG